MGNSKSIVQTKKSDPQYGGLFIELSNNRVLLPNETITGTIYLDLKQNYPGNSINLRLFGEERVHVIERQPRRTCNGYWEEQVHHKQNSTVIDQSLTIYTWQDSSFIPQGQYSFPFSFLVPAGLPGSLYLKKKMAQGAIHYELTASLSGNNSPDVFYTIPVVVREAVRNEIQGGVIKESSKVKTCCCCNQGIVDVGGSFQKNAYIPGETAKAMIEVDNTKCKKPITNVKFSLTQMVILKTPKCVHTELIKIRTDNFGGLEPGQSWLGDGAKLVSVTLPQEEEGTWQNFDEKQPIKENPNAKNLIIPSSKGKLIDSAFQLKIECEMKMSCSCGAKQPTPIHSIQVYSGALKPVEQPQIPLDWNPIEMDPFVFVVQQGDSPIGSGHNSMHQAFEIDGQPTKADQLSMMNNQMPMQTNQNKHDQMIIKNYH